jgi:hypothetical protein
MEREQDPREQYANWEAPSENIQQGETSIKELRKKIFDEADQITINPEDRDIQGRLLVRPDGPISNIQDEKFWRLIRTESFKGWYGKSRTLDENGEPVVMAHGSPDKFDEFRPSKRHNGIYFRPNPGIYSSLTSPALGWRILQKATDWIPGSMRHVYLGFLKIEKPYYSDGSDVMHISDEKLDALRKEGYDGVFGFLGKKKQLETKKHKGQEIIAFDPEQILIVETKSRQGL